MTIKLKTLNEINDEAFEVLVREMGIANTLRFMMQFNTGSGDYTKERDQWLGNVTLDEIAAEMRTNRQDKQDKRS